MKGEVFKIFKIFYLMCFLYKWDYEKRKIMKGTELYDKYQQISAKRKKSEEIYKELLKQKVF